eukprot:NODE_7087_length_1610_cov_6.915037.p1 GENE.NODE_7087_length_1610_cov_6.915037~~NODE_7087_length_1610_cov_6.915037.p1  ORF type:complete len:465 (+),score=128.51 NODE_7087_length_1610_cov_6.915037:112-1395(+)
MWSRSGALTKWGQWAAVRLDFFPPGLCRELSMLQHDAPAHSWRATRAALEAIPGLEDVERRPLASGAVAQVHVAQYRGRRAAVKVRHPGIAERMHADLVLLMRLAALVDRLPGFGWVHLRHVLSQFQVMMLEQTDLSIEAGHLERFRKNFAQKAEWVRFPEVFVSTPDVLVESFEPGELMTTFAREWEGGPPKTSTPEQAIFTITRGQDAYLQMLMGDNVLHADFHPGNILYRDGASSDGLDRACDAGPKVVFLDAGMVTVQTRRERRNFVSMLQAMGDGDGKRCAEVMLTLAVVQDCPLPDDFTNDMGEVFRRTCPGYGRGIEIDVAVRAILSTLYTHCVTLDGKYASMIANIACLEGIVKDLDPRFNILDGAYPYLRTQQLLGDEAFRRIYRTFILSAPRWVWRLVYRVTAYSGIHGEQLLRFKI